MVGKEHGILQCRLLHEITFPSNKSFKTTFSQIVHFTSRFFFFFFEVDHFIDLPSLYNSSPKIVMTVSFTRVSSIFFLLTSSKPLCLLFLLIPTQLVVLPQLSCHSSLPPPSLPGSFCLSFLPFLSFPPALPHSGPLLPLYLSWLPLFYLFVRLFLLQLQNSINLCQHLQLHFHSRFQHFCHSFGFRYFYNYLRLQRSFLYRLDSWKKFFFLYKFR